MDGDAGMSEMDETPLFWGERLHSFVTSRFFTAEMRRAMVAAAVMNAARNEVPATERELARAGLLVADLASRGHALPGWTPRLLVELERVVDWWITQHATVTREDATVTTIPAPLSAVDWN